ncbi:MAG: hypothetical protein US72_C0012G0041 [Microgenomates group bacterium GW2011_GWC1_38_12]|nr:MAG: hypothetical protein US72_C0012G0041 [Microgenomates group bacterium GW2011_GWC1_38_12]
MGKGGSERPDWCRDWVIRGGYVSDKTRNSYYREFRELSQKDPEELRQRCFQIMTKI